MSINGKFKGNNFEREVSNYLSDRFAVFTGKSKSFRRAVDSGSYFGGANQNRTETHLQEHQHFGDIVCPAAFKWSIEAKSYKTPFSLNSIILQKNTQLDEWINQVESDAKNSNKMPLLIIKFNACKTFVLSTELHPETRFSYKAYRCYPLEEFFSRDDSSYFNKI